MGIILAVGIVVLAVIISYRLSSNSSLDDWHEIKVDLDAEDKEQIG